MTQKSFNSKLITLVAVICVIMSSLSAFILYRNSIDTKAYQSIATNSLPKIKVLGEILSTFRQLRIEIRSLGIEGNTAIDNEKYKKNALKQVKIFEKSLAKFKTHLNTEFERKDFEVLESSWKNFFLFGQNILGLLAEGTPESMSKLREDIRVICPVKAKNISDILRKIIADEKNAADALVSKTNSDAKNTFYTAIILISLVSFVAIFVGIIFATRISKGLSREISSLINSTNSLDEMSVYIKDASTSLADAVQAQASSLQETVTSVDEISAMVSKNADNAKLSVGKANSVTTMANESMDKVSEMKKSIHDISQGNEEILSEISKSNIEIKNIASIIEGISEKTQVINDIVFQTKLLSFNASVEAARAGEHGKGFAVVAEEVGNLAAMSGKAANEINTMLQNSIKDVEKIVSESEHVMKRVSDASKVKMTKGLELAEKCDEDLRRVLREVSEVNKMVVEISEASGEQELGVKEVNKAMSDLDNLTQGNSSISLQTSRSATDLKEEVKNLSEISQKLKSLILGGKTLHIEKTVKTELKLIKNENSPKKSEKVSFSVPSSDDKRFIEL